MKIHSLLVICLLLVFTFIVDNSNAQTVYVTKEGKKYHKKNCSLVKEGKKGINLEEAKLQGLHPCSVCKPDQTNKTKDPKKTETVGPKLN